MIKRPLKRTGFVLLNAVLLLTLVTGMLGLMAHSYQQQLLNYHNLREHYQVQILKSLVQQQAKPKEIQKIKTNIGTANYDQKTGQITVVLSNQHREQFEIKSGTEK